MSLFSNDITMPIPYLMIDFSTRVYTEEDIRQIHDDAFPPLSHTSFWLCLDSAHAVDCATKALRFLIVEVEFFRVGDNCSSSVPKLGNQRC